MAVCLVDCLASFHRCAFFFPPAHRSWRLARKAGGASEAAAGTTAGAGTES